MDTSPLIILRPDGTIEFIGDFPVEEFDLGAVTRKRASHILPVHPLKRLAFRLLRLAFGERGRIATWTRHWHGPWQVILLPDGPTFIHPSRRVCLRWEHQQLAERMLAQL